MYNNNNIKYSLIKDAYKIKMGSVRLKSDVWKNRAVFKISNN
jgi:hypothetical protein